MLSANGTQTEVSDLQQQRLHRSVPFQSARPASTTGKYRKARRLDASRRLSLWRRRPPRAAARLRIAQPAPCYPVRMEYTRLGSAGVKVSRLCLGCMTYGSSKWREWILDEEQSRPFIRRALELGI